ncbi:hypothetical protein NE865_02113 [Phthorimaea operculella]|nr:hypothetical protein NE865_02113 [Phthorimaea operculella]
MIKSDLSVSLIVIVLVTITEAGFVAPVASGYIYRNDNHGPASLIQIGSLPYQQPQAFSPLLPLVQHKVHPLKLQAVEAYDLAPAVAPLPYILPKATKEEEEVYSPDDSDETSEEYLDGGDLNSDIGAAHAYEKEAGSDYDEEHHEAHGENGSKAYSSEDNHQDGDSGHYSNKHEKENYKQNKEEADIHYDEADTQGKHSQSAERYEGSNHGNKKHFSKGEDVTGYHKVFHKDEFKKDHDFYDVADNSGNSKKYENSHKQHHSKDGEQKKGAQHKSGYEKAGFGKEGYHAKHRNDENEEVHSAEEGHDSHYAHEDDYGQKGSKLNEKEYGYGEDGDIE